MIFISALVENKNAFEWPAANPIFPISPIAVPLAEI